MGLWSVGPGGDCGNRHFSSWKARSSDSAGEPEHASSWLLGGSLPGLPGLQLCSRDVRPKVPEPMPAECLRALGDAVTLQALLAPGEFKLHVFLKPAAIL